MFHPPIPLINDEHVELWRKHLVRHHFGWCSQTIMGDIKLQLNQYKGRDDITLKTILEEVGDLVETERFLEGMEK